MIFMNWCLLLLQYINLESTHETLQWLFLIVEQCFKLSAIIRSKIFPTIILLKCPICIYVISHFKFFLGFFSANLPKSYSFIFLQYIIGFTDFFCYVWEERNFHVSKSTLLSWSVYPKKHYWKYMLIQH